MKVFGIFLMVGGAMCLLVEPIFGIIFIIIGFIFFALEKHEVDKKELYIARRIILLTNSEGMTTMEAKKQAELEYILERNK